ncbi:putative ubiquinone biosynthesis protein UbiB [compost metagenome]
MARRLNPDHDLWEAAKPVVERWIKRELGPQAQIRETVEEALATLKALSHLAQNPPQSQTLVIEKAGTRPWVVAAVTVAVCASVAALVLTLWPMIVA